jgi:hypothetical protein
MSFIALGIYGIRISVRIPGCSGSDVETCGYYSSGRRGVINRWGWETRLMICYFIIIIKVDRKGEDDSNREEKGD